MSSLALFVAVMVLTLPAISTNQEMVCIKNSASSDSAIQCVYREKAGEKGQKGDPGAVIEDSGGVLRGELDTLRQQMKALNASINDLRQGMTGQNIVWFASNGYRYRATPNAQTWNESRRVCQDFGGDLAVHGIQTIESRMKISNALSLPNTFWIGASDEDSEDVWKWVNGNIATQEQLLWSTGEPNNHKDNEDCAQISVPPPHNARSNDRSCSVVQIGLCESLI